MNGTDRVTAPLQDDSSNGGGEGQIRKSPTAMPTEPENLPARSTVLQTCTARQRVVGAMQDVRDRKVVVERAPDQRKGCGCNCHKACGSCATGGLCQPFCRDAGLSTGCKKTPDSAKRQGLSNLSPCSRSRFLFPSKTNCFRRRCIVPSPGPILPEEWRVVNWSHTWPQHIRTYM